MTSATVDRSEFRHILQSGTIVGAVTAAAVVLFLLVSRVLPAGIATSLLQMIIVLAAGVAAAFLPGFFAASRTTQGVASAAAMALWGTIVFMAIDIVLLRPFARSRDVGRRRRWQHVVVSPDLVDAGNVPRAWMREIHVVVTADAGR